MSAVCSYRFFHQGSIAEKGNPLINRELYFKMDFFGGNNDGKVFSGNVT
jgi:hypothetical protein